MVFEARIRTARHRVVYAERINQLITRGFRHAARRAMGLAKRRHCRLIIHDAAGTLFIGALFPVTITTWNGDPIAFLVADLG